MHLKQLIRHTSADEPVVERGMEERVLGRERLVVRVGAKGFDLLAGA